MRKYLLLYILIISFVLILSPTIQAASDVEEMKPRLLVIPLKAKGGINQDEPESFVDQKTGMEFVLVKGGCFQIGDTFRDGYDDEKPVHEVCVDDFYIGKYEVIQGQWESIMRNNPSIFNNGSEYPVEKVSWDDVQGFIRKLNKKTGQNCRLPTEVEWEYAARSGGKREKWAGTSTESELGQYAWYSSNSGDKTHPVGQKRPNGLGIYDMSGNVWEWCQDLYSKLAYRKHQRNNPIYTESGSRRVVRGGGWGVRQMRVRASYRLGHSSSIRHSHMGFRLARTP